MILSPLKCLCTFVKNQLNIFVWVYFWTLLWFIDLCVYPLGSVLITIVFVASLKISKCDSPTFFFFKIGLATSIPLDFHRSFQIRLLISKKFLLGLHWLYRSILEGLPDWYLNNIESSNPGTQYVSLHLFISFFLSSVFCTFQH